MLSPFSAGTPPGLLGAYDALPEPIVGWRLEVGYFWDPQCLPNLSKIWPKSKWAEISTTTSVSGQPETAELSYWPTRLVGDIANTTTALVLCSVEQELCSRHQRLCTAVAWNSLLSVLRVVSLCDVSYARHLRAYLIQVGGTWYVFNSRNGNICQIVGFFVHSTTLYPVWVLPPIIYYWDWLTAGKQWVNDGFLVAVIHSKLRLAMHYNIIWTKSWKTLTVP